MHRTPAQLRSDALRIWMAGLSAVRSPGLVFDAIATDGSLLHLGGATIDLSETNRIAVVGGGKAAAGMARALEQALGPAIAKQHCLSGIVNVPADCIIATDVVRLVAARPAGLNEPTPEGAAGVQQMLELVRQLGPRDLCICLLSGGGSALMPAPIDGLSLADKLELTRAMSAAGATIHQLNSVRRELSRVKGGGLAHACRAGRLASLIISDVLGDDLSLVASGPTVLRRPTPLAAIEALNALQLHRSPTAMRVIKTLEGALSGQVKANDAELAAPEPPAIRNDYGCEVTNHLLANNATAVDAAGVEAERLGYSHAMICETPSEGTAEDVARRLVEIAQRMRGNDGPDCLISGGEPSVRLAPMDVRGRGGRNQQLCLTALHALADWRGTALISGGTDGEDGPTDAAGACVDELVAGDAERLRLNPRDYLARNDAYSYFEQAGGLLLTGPTHTNVCDLRVLTVSR